MGQINDAQGVVGWSLGLNLPSLEFYTLSAWESATDLRSFLGSGPHGQGVEKFASSMRRESIFVQFSVLGRDLPLQWKDGLRRQDERLGS